MSDKFKYKNDPKFIIEIIHSKEDLEGLLSFVPQKTQENKNLAEEIRILRMLRTKDKNFLIKVFNTNKDKLYDLAVSYMPKSILNDPKLVMEMIKIDTNVISLIGDQQFGCGGFIDIAHATPKIIFVGSFTTKGLEINYNNSQLSILQEGNIQKFVGKISHITFSSKSQKEVTKEIIIITERCVFIVRNRKLVLVEIAEGIDIDRDILDQMAFKPMISENLIKMNFSFS